MRYPRNVDVWEYAPGRKLAEVVIRVKSVRGAVAVCNKAVAEMGVSILDGSVAATRPSRTATWSFSVDLTDSSFSVKGFRERLLRLPIVESVQIVPSQDGLVVDEQRFPVLWGGRRAVILRADALTEMVDRLWDVFGTGAATIIDQMAEAMGRHSAKEVVDDLGRDFAKDHLEALMGTYTALGFADVALEPGWSSEPRLTVHARQLFECQANIKRKVRRRSVFFRAHIRGFVEEIYGAEAEVEEVQCLAEGGEECSFRVSVPAAAMAPVQARAKAREPDPQS